jgi:hypothetical protein
MKNIYRVYQSCIKALLKNGATTATKFASPTRTIKAINLAREDGATAAFTIIDGPPSSAGDKQFIADCKKAKEKFPVRKIQLTGVTKKDVPVVAKAPKKAPKTKAKPPAAKSKTKIATKK